MTFQTVPPIDSAEYINSQKSAFETEYYVDNLNTLGAGGSGGGQAAISAIASIETGGITVPDYTGAFAGWTDVITPSGAMTYDAPTGVFEVVETGTYAWWLRAVVTDASAGNLFNVGLCGNQAPYFTTWIQGGIAIGSGQLLSIMNFGVGNFTAGDEYFVSANNPSLSTKWAAGSQTALVINKIS